MKFYIVRVGNLRYRDLQPSVWDAIDKAMRRFPNARVITAKVAP